MMGMSILIITHDLGIIAEMADDVAVMYASKIVEQAPVKELFAIPLHPLHDRAVQLAARAGQVEEQEAQHHRGMVPSPLHFPSGCKFHPRCPFAKQDANWTSRSSARFGQVIGPAATLPRRSPEGELSHDRAAGRRQHLKKYFPVRRGVFSRVVGTRAGGRRVSFRFAGRNLGLGRRVGLRQDDRRAHALAVDRANRRGRLLRWPGRRDPAARTLRDLRRDMQIVFQDPFSSLNPRMTVRSIVEEGLMIHRLGNAQRAAGESRSENAEPGRARPELRQPLSARILRRTAAADRASPGRWCSSRSSWCSTNRSRHWMFRSSRRSSICLST